MSHYIVGQIKVPAGGERNLVVEHLVRVAVKEGLTARSIVETKATLQFEILAAAQLNGGSDLIFFDIVGPLGTADELISPYVVIDQWPLSIKANLHAISKVAASLLEEQVASEMSIVFSEGYDTHYESCEITPAAATNFLLHRFSDAGEVPSLKIKLT